MGLHVAVIQAGLFQAAKQKPKTEDDAYKGLMDNDESNPDPDNLDAGGPGSGCPLDPDRGVLALLFSWLRRSSCGHAGVCLPPVRSAARATNDSVDRRVARCDPRDRPFD